jgi:hypothetical protein
MKLKELKQLIGIKTKDIIGPTLKGWNGKKGHCCLHDEKTASMAWHEASLSFKCFGCDENYDIINHLKKLHGNSYIDELHKLAGVENEFKKPEMLSAQGRTFLAGRGIKKNHGKHITSDNELLYFNYYQNGKFWNYKKRRIFATTKKDRFLGGINGRGYDLFLMDEADYSKPLYCTEGETDCLTLKEIGLNAVSYGGTSSLSLINQRLQFFRKFPEVIFICDGDGPGAKLYKRVYDLPLNDAYRILIDEKLNDVNNIYLKHGKNKLKEILKVKDKCEGYKELLKECDDLELILKSHFENCNNIYRKDEKSYIVIGTKNQIFTTTKYKEVISASGIDIIDYTKRFKKFTEIASVVFTQYSHIFPECKEVSYDITKGYGEIYQDSNGDNTLNLYKKLGACYQYEADKSIKKDDFPTINKHFNHMYKENADYVYKLLAWNLQYIGKASTVAIVHQSKDQGSGKGLMSKLWMKIFSNYAKVSQNDLKRDFNGFIRKKIVVAEEVSIDDAKLADSIKPYITEDFNSLNLKRETVIDVRNYMQWIINTNRTIGVHLENSDRRYYVCTQKKLKDEDLILKLDEIYNSVETHEEIINLIKYCKAIPVTRVEIKNIPMTEIKQKVMANSVTKIQECLEDLAHDIIGELDHLIKTDRFKDEYFSSLKTKALETFGKYGNVRLTLNEFREIVKTKAGKKDLKGSSIDKYLDDIDGISKTLGKIFKKTSERCYMIKYDNVVKIEDCQEEEEEEQEIIENPFAETQHQFDY